MYSHAFKWHWHVRVFVRSTNQSDRPVDALQAHGAMKYVLSLSMHGLGCGHPEVWFVCQTDEPICAESPPVDHSPFHGDRTRYVDNQPLRKTEGVSRSPWMSRARLGPPPWEFCVVPNEVDLSTRSGLSGDARGCHSNASKSSLSALAQLVATITIIRPSLARACPSLPLRWPSDRNVTCGFSLVAEQFRQFRASEGSFLTKGPPVWRRA